MPFQVIGTRHHHAPVLRQLDADQAGVGQFADADGAVDALVHQVDQAVGEVEVDRHLGVGIEELHDQRRDVPAAEAGRRGEAQMAARLDAAQAHRRLGIAEFAQYALAILEVGAALEGQRHAPRRAQQQLDAEARFQRIQAAAHHPRRHALGGRGGGQAAAVGHGNEGFDLLQAAHVSFAQKATMI